MRDETIDRIRSTDNEIQHAVGQSCFIGQLHFADRAERHLFTGLEDERVAAGDGHGPHPHGHHDREVEWRDAGAHTKGQSFHGAVERYVLIALTTE